VNGAALLQVGDARPSTMDDIGTDTSCAGLGVLVARDEGVLAVRAVVVRDDPCGTLRWRESWRSPEPLLLATQSGPHTSLGASLGLFNPCRVSTPARASA
jgi:hypothetical protein